MNNLSGISYCIACKRRIRKKYFLNDNLGPYGKKCFEKVMSGSNNNKFSQLIDGPTLFDSVDEDSSWSADTTK